MRREEVGKNRLTATLSHVLMGAAASERPTVEAAF